MIRLVNNFTAGSVWYDFILMCMYADHIYHSPTQIFKRRCSDHMKIKKIHWTFVFRGWLHKILKYNLIIPAKI